MATTMRRTTADTPTIQQIYDMRASNDSQRADRMVMWQVLKRLRDQFRNRILGGHPIIQDATTPSTQATGDAGATVVNINHAAFLAVVNGTCGEFTASVDEALHDTTVYTGADAGEGTTTLTTTNHHAVITLVLKSSSATPGAGSVSLVVCKGGCSTTAALALAAQCTDAEIQTKVTGSLPWIKLGHVLLNRTGDTAITVTFDNTIQPLEGVNVGSDFWCDWED